VKYAKSDSRRIVHVLPEFSSVRHAHEEKPAAATDVRAAHATPTTYFC